MVHRADLEAELARGVIQIAPQVIGNDYLVLGTVKKKIWQVGLRGRDKPLAEILKHVADFKRRYDLEYKPGGWYPAIEGPKRT